MVDCSLELGGIQAWEPCLLSELDRVLACSELDGGLCLVVELSAMLCLLCELGKLLGNSELGRTLLEPCRLR